MSLRIFHYGEDYLTAGKVIQLANGQLQGVISSKAREKISKSRQSVEGIVAKEKPVYGINTGFGPLCTTMISEKDTKTLQSNILKSHSVGVGTPVDKDIAKIMMILKLQSLCKGYSGIAQSTLDRIFWHIDNEAIPVVPSQGSVGASGDLAPLSHLFLPLIGFGEVNYKGSVIPTAQLLQENQLEPLKLGPKEGLALINGTQFIAAHAVKIVVALQHCLSQADIIGALMIEGLQGSLKPFFDELHQLRPYRGNKYVASRIKALLQDSEINTSHIYCSRVQDPYSIRCIPQVHGASRNAWLHLKELLEIELNSVTDNPIIIDENLTISGGNFHGQPIAMAIDYACLAASEIGNISDRRIYLSLEGSVPGVPKLLFKETGLNSGFMILQYTTAALVSENKGLCFPSSADSIPTSLGQEDHVSMGSIGGRKALKVVHNLQKILAIELMTAMQAIDFRRPLKSSKILEAVYTVYRKQIPFYETDKVFASDIEKSITFIKNNTISKVVEEAAKEYHIPLRSSYESLFESY